jgi:uncharacterized membrane protein YgcG
MTTRSRLLTGALLVAVLAPATALAGTLQIRDPGDVLPAQEEASLRQAAQAWPFDARVVVTTEMPSRAAFSRYVGAQVAGPNMVVVGVDPLHRLTSVHFGTGTRIARSRFRAIEDAGDGWFRQGQWSGGVEAIFTSAASAVGSGSPVAGGGAQLDGGQESAPSFPWGLMLLGVGGVLIAVMVFRAMRNRSQAYPMGPGVDPYRAQQYPQGYGAPGGYNPGYGPHYGPQGGGMSNLGAGVIGAGVGGLAGYALGSALANRDEHHGADHYAGSGYDDGSSSYDAGGSTSGWDDGGGGGDFGGGDSGGGGDW